MASRILPKFVALPDLPAKAGDHFDTIYGMNNAVAQQHFYILGEPMLCFMSGIAGKLRWCLAIRVPSVQHVLDAFDSITILPRLLLLS